MAGELVKMVGILSIHTCLTQQGGLSLKVPLMGFLDKDRAIPVYGLETASLGLTSNNYLTCLCLSFLIPAGASYPCHGYKVLLIKG